jgi:transcriptional regulator with XRE-family HTH domain
MLSSWRPPGDRARIEPDTTGQDRADRPRWTRSAFSGTLVLVATRFNHPLLARARLDLGLTQEEAAQAAGVDVRTYRRYESGEVNDAVRGFAVRHPSRRQFLQRLEAELGLGDGELLVEDEAPRAPSPTHAQQDWPIRFAHALPRARHFVGREGVLARLRAWSDAPAGGVAVLVAVGGAGKTSVVARFLALVSERPRPGGVFVWSFYEDPRVEAFFEQAVAYVVPEGERCKPGEREAALEAALRGGAHLLVLDGMELVQETGAPGLTHGGGGTLSTYGRIEDTSLRRLLTRLARGLGASRALVTSRIELTDLTNEDEGFVCLRLDSLSDAEGDALLRSWGLHGDARDLAPLLAHVQGHALSVAMIGSYAATFLEGDASRALGIELGPAAREDPAARRLLDVLGSYAKALPPEERDLMARLSLFPSGADARVLAAIARAGGAVAGALAGLDEDHVKGALRRLERLGLVFGSVEGTRYTTHPFIGQYFRSLLHVAPAEVHAVTRATLAAQLESHRVRPTGKALLDAYEELLAHARAAGAVEEAWGIYRRSLGGFAQLGLRLGEMTRGARVLRGFLEGGPEGVDHRLSTDTRGRVLYDLGLYTGALGDLTYAARCYRAHNEVMQGEANLPARVVGLRTLAYTERLRGELRDALALATASTDLARAGELPGEAARGLALRASILHDLGQVRLAREAFEEVRRMGDEPFARRALWEAEHAAELGELDAARSATERNVETCRTLGWEGHAAHGETLLGEIALREGRPAVGKAEAHARVARRWTASTGEAEMVLRTLLLEAKVALARADAGAQYLIEEGAALAASGGFALFHVRFLNLRAGRDPADGRFAGEALQAARARSDYAWGLADALHVAGVSAAAAGDRVEAARLLDEALAVRGAILHPGVEITRQRRATL